MIVSVTPKRLDVRPGVGETLRITVSNTSDVIGGYTLRVLGADPGWVDAPEQTFSLFPDETREIAVGVRVPHGIPAGERRIAVQLRELTPPERTAIDELVLVVPEDPSVNLRVDPLVTQAGRRARYTVLVDNNGNTALAGRLAGTDPEAKVRYRFEPPVVNLAPGEHAVVDVKAKGKQPALGSPVVRVLNFYLDDEPTQAVLEAKAEQAKSEADAANAAAKAAKREEKKKLAPKAFVPSKKIKPAIPERDSDPLAVATLIQRAFIGRGLVSLLGLLAAISVFAIVITIALSKIVGQSAADRDLALQIAEASNNNATSGTSSMAGTVRLLTSGSPVPGVAVTVYAADKTDTPLATAATKEDGTYSIGDLPAGDYKMNFRGAGFVQLWYPNAVDPADGATITLDSDHEQGGLNVTLGGVPATISGTIKGDDVSGATLSLLTPVSTATVAGTDGTSSSGASTPATTGAGAATAAYTAPLARVVAAANSSPSASAEGDASALATQGGAVVKTVAIGADGTFTLEGIPSPSVYIVQVTKPGYATSSQLIDVSGGETRQGLNITLRKGDGVISGTVNSASGPVGNVTITATSGQTTVTTVSLDSAQSGSAMGSFVLRGLPTPAQFIVVASAPGYASQTMSVTLASGQDLSGVSLTLGASSGGLSGNVKLAGASGQPAAGVSVTVTNGTQTVQTASESSGQVGHWQVTGLAVPGTYTVTFSRADLATQTVSVSLDSDGNITSESVGGGVTPTAITTTMRSSTATLSGVVQQKVTRASTAPSNPIGEATVVLSNGTSSYTVTTASLPASAMGGYQIEGIPPGTYTVSVSLGGVSPTSQIITLSAGESATFNPKLDPAASISGTVVDSSGTSVPAGYVVYLYRAANYPSIVYRETTTGQGGTFSFPNLDAPETYVIEVRPTKASAPTGTTATQLDPSQALTGVRVTSND